MRSEMFVKIKKEKKSVNVATKIIVSRNKNVLIQENKHTFFLPHGLQIIFYPVQGIQMSWCLK